ncbi:MAG: excinuclease ABC subunit UvrC [Planctomycetes bacterium]|nr:excinuclease ABC subunit UvrC [Planctomycetota bacterium]
MVLYVGKAIHIRKRVQVYRKQGADGRARMADLLARAHAAEFFVTDTEKEALLLEDRLVKLHHPPLNVLLKDDKSFLHISLDEGHSFPRLSLERKRRSGVTCFGPYPSATSARQAKRLLMRAFGLRDCSDRTFRTRKRPCLKFGLGLCAAPCVQKVDEATYAGFVAQAKSVLGGDVLPRIRIEEKAMKAYSDSEDYEAALRSRERVKALRALAAPQKVRLDPSLDFDVLGIDARGEFALLQYRQGDWLHTRHGRIPIASDRSSEVRQLLAALYRDIGSEIPPLILAPHLPDDLESREAQLSEWSGHKVEIKAPQRGEKRALVRMAESNARARRGESPTTSWAAVAQRLADLCAVDEPMIVDCIDISHFQGGERVAAKVRFVEGRPARSFYRRYQVKDGKGNDDFEGMREVVARMCASQERDGLPDLLVLDGGKGQLSAGLEAMPSEVEMPIVALAKARPGKGAIIAQERLFLPGKGEPTILVEHSPERFFLEAIRDEAHRFAITFHRKKRDSLRILLEQIPGVGPKKRAKLLDHCKGDLSSLLSKPEGALAEIPGITSELEARILAHLRQSLG